MKKEDCFKKYCTGCGMCAENGVQFKMDNNGFVQPLLKPENIALCEEICPASAKAFGTIDSYSPWGHYEAVEVGYSSDTKIRYQASSGGIISTTAIYLLENNIVDGILHCGADKSDPLNTVLYCSTNRSEVMERCGSRYNASSPLMELRKYIQKGKKYAFIGKPCDVGVLKRYCEKDSELKGSIIFLFSFFCAGVPSRNANEKLLDEMGCGCKNVKSLNYRGKGWPGYAVAYDSNGIEYTMSYNNSWGKILGRDVRTCCHFCLDGIGEQADISCGDAWYIADSGKPDFSEHDGRNVIFVRTKRGTELLNRMKEDGVITAQDYAAALGELDTIQYYQKNRRTTIAGKILALIYMRKVRPNYPFMGLVKLSGCAGLKSNMQVFWGIVMRIKEGKIIL